MIQIWTARTEQGFEFRQHGNSFRTILDYGGLALVTTFKPPKEPRPSSRGKKRPEVDPDIPF